MHVEPDAVLLLGDCLCASPGGVLTPDSALRLRDAIIGFVAEHHVEGHHGSASSRTELEALFEKLRLAERAAREGTAIDTADEDTVCFLAAFRAGRPA